MLGVGVEGPSGGSRRAGGPVVSVPWLLRPPPVATVMANKPAGSLSENETLRGLLYGSWPCMEDMRVDGTTVKRTACTTRCIRWLLTKVTRVR